MVGVGSSLCDLGFRLESVISIGVLILALTSLLAKDGFFSFEIVGLVAKVELSVGSAEIRCQLDKTFCFIRWLLSLNLIGTTSGCISFGIVVDDSRASLFSNLIWHLISLGFISSVDF